MNLYSLNFSSLVDHKSPEIPLVIADTEEEKSTEIAADNSSALDENDNKTSQSQTNQLIHEAVHSLPNFTFRIEVVTTTATAVQGGPAVVPVPDLVTKVHIPLESVISEPIAVTSVHAVKASNSDITEEHSENLAASNEADAQLADIEVPKTEKLDNEAETLAVAVEDTSKSSFIIEPIIPAKEVTFESSEASAPSDQESLGNNTDSSNEENPPLSSTKLSFSKDMENTEVENPFLAPAPIPPATQKSITGIVRQVPSEKLGKPKTLKWKKGKKPLPLSNMSGANGTGILSKFAPLTAEHQPKKPSIKNKRAPEPPIVAVPPAASVSASPAAAHADTKGTQKQGDKGKPSASPTSTNKNPFLED